MALNMWKSVERKKKKYERKVPSWRHHRPPYGPSSLTILTMMLLTFTQVIPSSNAQEEYNYDYDYVYAPTSPTELTVKQPSFKGNTTTSSIGSISWEEPTDSNGILIEYLLQLESTKENKTCKVYQYADVSCDKNVECSFSEKRCHFRMAVNTTYTFHLSAKNDEVIGYGEPSSTTVTTIPYGWPYIKEIPYMTLGSEETEKYSLYKSFPIAINTSAFSHINGPITKCQILLMKINPNTSNNRVGTEDQLNKGMWDKVPAKVVYSALTFPEIFVFGDEDESKCVEGEDCNEELDSITIYFFKFRIFSYTNFIDSQPYRFKTEEHITRNVLISIIIIISIIILVIVMVIVFTIYMRICSPRKKQYVLQLEPEAASTAV